MIPYDFTCKVCGSHRYILDTDGVFDMKQCLDCDMQASAVGAGGLDAGAVIDVEPINRNEITSVAMIAASYLIGRKIVLGGQIVHIKHVFPTYQSRMALTILSDDGRTSRVYLPTRIELIPEGQDA